MRSLMGAALLALLHLTEDLRLRRAGPGRSLRLRVNRGSGAGYQRAVAREAASARWRDEFYADFDAKRRGAHA